MSRSRIAARFARRACLLTLATACVDPALAPPTFDAAAPRLARQDASGDANIGGQWQYDEAATFLIFHYAGSGGAKPFRCSSTGTYTFVQAGSTFTGSYDQVGTCTASDGTTFPNNFTGIGVEGTINGRHIRFMTADGCSYEGAVRGATLGVMGGAAQCGGPKFGGTYRASWSATRR